MKPLLKADIQACDRIIEFHLPSSHQAWGNGDKLQSLHGLTEAEASCREISRTFKSSIPWIWGTTPAQIPPCFMQIFIADGPTSRTRNSNIPMAVLLSVAPGSRNGDKTARLTMRPWPGLRGSATFLSTFRPEITAVWNI
uniref:cDNA FLJ26858 fis, clone PRS08274 n=1 Tax=Homo sapiens TaxID=9606 RepID=Q6ZNZ1_HUMAN|nr:unnamed protein product [Homo sapiens]